MNFVRAKAGSDLKLVTDNYHEQASHGVRNASEPMCLHVPA